MKTLRTGGWKTSILWVVVVCALVSGLGTLVQRNRVEADNVNVELMMDYTMVKTFSDSIGLSPLTVLERMKEAGITSVAITEETIETLLEDNAVTVLQGKELLSMQRLSGRELIPMDDVVPNYTYLIGEQDNIPHLYERLSKRLGVSNVTMLFDGRMIELSRSGDDLNKRGIGFCYELIEQVSTLGLKVVARPYNFPGITEEDIETTFKELTDSAEISGVIFAGREVYGYPAHIDVTAGQLERYNIRYGAAETPVQRGFIPAEGMDELFGVMDYQVVRVYSATVSEIRNPSIANLVDNAVRSVKERNIRSLYLRPMMNWPDASPEQQLETNLNYIGMIVSELENQGYVVDVAEPFGSFWTNRLLTGLVMGGTIAAGLITVNLFYPLPLTISLILTGLGTLLSFLLLGTGYGLLWRQGMAVLASTVFPVLGAEPYVNFSTQYRQFTTRLRVALVAFLRMVGVSLIGGLFVAALLADIPFLIEYQYFRGVKLVHILPLMILGLVYLRNKGAKKIQENKPIDRIRQVYLGGRELIVEKVHVGHLVGALLVAAAGYIYIGRTGHTAGIPVPNIEVQLRAMLDKVLYIRPRTKEFMIGHPAFMFGIYLAGRGYQLYAPLIIIGSVIGQISLINSFAHLRTPVLLSFFRTWNGVWMGIVFGVLACIAAELIIRITEALRRSIHD